MSIRLRFESLPIPEDLLVDFWGYLVKEFPKCTSPFARVNSCPHDDKVSIMKRTFTILSYIGQDLE